MKNLIEIKNDLYGISKAIKSIDKKYRLYFNTKKERYEVHYLNGLNQKLEVVLPYKNLDRRSVIHMEKTQIKNLEKIVKEIDEKNQEIEEKNDKKILNDMVDKINLRRNVW